MLRPGLPGRLHARRLTQTHPYTSPPSSLEYGHLSSSAGILAGDFPWRRRHFSPNCSNLPR